jgi:hypothetical protein
MDLCLFSCFGAVNGSGSLFSYPVILHMLFSFM